MDFENKVAIVTGAANGIGHELTKSLYQRGCTIIACDIQQEKLKEVYADFDKNRLHIKNLDVTNAERWKEVANETIGEFKKIDLLLNIAGIIEPGYIYETEIKKIDRQIDINLKGTIYGVREVSPFMVRQKSGHIINISSMAGLAPVPGLNIYSATKFGIRGFSMAVASELEGFGVKVSVVCPDAVKTGMLDYQKDKKEAAMTFSADKYLTAEDVTQAIIRLIEKPKVQLWLPRSRGILATMGSIFPGLTSKLKNKLIKKGLEKQKNYQ